MNRRALLASTAGALALAAGCSSLSSDPAPLGDPTVDRLDEGTRAYNFARDGQHIAGVDVRVQQRDGPTAPRAVGVEVTPADEWRTEAVEIGFRAPAVLAAGEQPAAVSLQVPDGPRYPPFRLWQDEQGYARIRTEGLVEADLGDGTLVLSAVLEPRAPAEELSFASTTTHRNGRRTTAEASVVDRLPLSA